MASHVVNNFVQHCSPHAILRNCPNRKLIKTSSTDNYWFIYILKFICVVTLECKCNKQNCLCCFHWLHAWILAAGATASSSTTTTTTTSTTAAKRPLPVKCWSKFNHSSLTWHPHRHNTTQLLKMHLIKHKPTKHHCQGTNRFPCTFWFGQLFQYQFRFHIRFSYVAVVSACGIVLHVGGVATVVAAVCASVCVYLDNELLVLFYVFRM